MGARAGLPQALAQSLAPEGTRLSVGLLSVAEILVAGTLSPQSRHRYAFELGRVSAWCDEHSRDLLDLAPSDVAAMVVARRAAGQSPKSMLSALAFVYRRKPQPADDIVALAQRVDAVWRHSNRDILPVHHRAVVLPLRCWQDMHRSVRFGARGVGAHEYDEERYYRDRFILSLGVSDGLRAGEFGLLSAARSRIGDGGRALVLPLILDRAGATTKTGRSEIVVPLDAPPFHGLPLREDFEALRRLRLQRGGDRLVAAAWHYGASNGISSQRIPQLLQARAASAGIAGGGALSGGSLRRSMVHIAVAAGWTLDQVAEVTGHTGTRELERTYLDGYYGSWLSSPTGRDVLLGESGVPADCPMNVAFTASDAPAAMWWRGRDLDSDRAEAMALAKGTPRVGAAAARDIPHAGRCWEAFCHRVGADAATPTPALLDAFATDLVRQSTSKRDLLVRYLTDYFAAHPSIDVADIPQIRQWVIAAAHLANSVTLANRRKNRNRRAARNIVPVREHHMEAIFSTPLLTRTEGRRLRGIALRGAEHSRAFTSSERERFRFGEHAHVGATVAELFAPPTAGAPPDDPQRTAAVATVAPGGEDALWCPYEAVRRLVEFFPDKRLHPRKPDSGWPASCTTLIRWLQCRAAVAVMYATGLRASDLDALRWTDLRATKDGAILWRLPYGKGNRSGDRIQVLRLPPADKPWCPVAALQRLADSIQMARAAGWTRRTAAADSDAVVRRVFCTFLGKAIVDRLLVPAGVPVRPQDFRYRKAADVWATTRDMQQVRASLFHSRETASAVYVARGMPASVRAELDQLSGVFAAD